MTRSATKNLWRTCGPFKAESLASGVIRVIPEFLEARKGLPDDVAPLGVAGRMLLAHVIAEVLNQKYHASTGRKKKEAKP